MINFDTQFETLSDFIFTAIGERPYPLDKDFIKPKDPYIAIKVAKVTPDGWSGINLPVTDPDGYQECYQSCVLRYSIEAVRDDAMVRLSSIAMAFREPPMQDYLREGGLAYQKHTPPTDSSTTLDGVITEDRAMMYVDFGAILQNPTRRGEVPLTIERITVKPTYTN